MQEVVQTSGRLWPGVGTLLRFATTWETSIVDSLFLTTAWILLFTLLIISITRKDALAGLLLRLRWPFIAIVLFGGLFWLVANADDWLNNRYDNTQPGIGIALALIALAVVAGIFFGKIIYLAATDVFRGDDAHPLLAPFVSTGVSWTLAYLALSSGGQSAIPGHIRLLVTLSGPVLVTLINAWTCQRIRLKHGGDVLFRDGPDGTRPRPAAVFGSAPSRREVLRLALPPAVLLGSSPLWAPSALALASTRSDEVVTWMLPTEQPPNALSDGALVTSVTFSPDGRTLAFGTTDGLVELWDVADPARPVPPAQPLTGQAGVSWIAFSPSGRILASGSSDTTIHLWDVSDPSRPAALGRPLHTMHQVSSLAFSLGGRTLAACSNDNYSNFGDGAGIIQLWDITDPVRPGRLARFGTSQEGYSSVAFSPDGRTLAAGSLLGTVQLWDVTDLAHPSALRSLPTSVTGGYIFVAFSPSGHILAGGDEDGAIYLWDVAHPAHPAAQGPPLSIADQVSSLTFSPDGRTLAASSNRGYSDLGPFGGTGTICLWDISDPARPSSPTKFATAPAPGFCSIAFSPDGHILAGASDGGAGNNPGSVQLWDITNPTRPAALGQPIP